MKSEDQQARRAGELLPQPDVAEIDLVKVMHALGDSTRMHLFRTFAETGLQCDCSSERLGLSHLHKSTVSHHLRILRESGLTSTWAVGRNRYVELRRDDLESRFPGLVEVLLSSGTA
ncbi:metalloregulator ArsR/SmtB family transcription factor [Streptomyces albiaxialis]|uniref:Metalloregulator ArsR/SmtB family transcription factor n=1 Tax=Streptomyces albiaxialis TaxID=329523 RepID=A0ABN2VGK4_9ACTN